FLGGIGRPAGVHALKENQQELQATDESADTYQQTSVENVLPIELKRFPPYGFVLIGWIAGALAAVGEWLWGYYGRRWAGLSLGLIAIFILIGDWILLFSA